MFVAPDNAYVQCMPNVLRLCVDILSLVHSIKYVPHFHLQHSTNLGMHICRPLRTSLKTVDEDTVPCY